MPGSRNVPSGENYQNLWLSIVICDMMMEWTTYRREITAVVNDRRTYVLWLRLHVISCITFLKFLLYLKSKKVTRNIILYCLLFAQNEPFLVLEIKCIWCTNGKLHQTQWHQKWQIKLRSIMCSSFCFISVKNKLKGRPETCQLVADVSGL